MSENIIVTTDFILLILNCEKYRYKALKQKESWLKDFTIMPYFHVIGNPELDRDYLFDHTEKLLYVKTPDDYNSLPKKVIAAYTAVYKEYTFKYIFKTDDDQNLINNNFFKIMTSLLLNKIPKIHYAGQIINVDIPIISEYYKVHPELPKDIVLQKTSYCIGRFYILSDLAVQQLISKTENIKNEYFEDYAVGFNLDPILKQNMLNFNTQQFFCDFI